MGKFLMIGATGNIGSASVTQLTGYLEAFPRSIKRGSLEGRANAPTPGVSRRR